MASRKAAAPTMTQWQALFKAADAVKALRPWVTLPDTTLLAIQMPRREAPVYFSTLGNGDDCYGISVYEDPQSLSRMLHTVEAEDPLDFIGYQNCLACYFSDRDELEKEDYALIKALGLRYRGAHQWPQFRAIRPGRIPWEPTRDDVVLLTECLLQYARHYPALNNMDVTTDTDLTDPYCLFLCKDGTWSSDSDTLSKLFQLHEVMRLGDEVTMARLKKRGRTKARLALDFFYLPFPIQNSPKDIPFFIRPYYLLDTDDEMIVTENTLHPDNAEAAMLDDLIHYFLDNGLPATLSVRDEVTAATVGWLCEQLDIRLRVGSDLDLLDQVREDLIDSLLEEF